MHRLTLVWIALFIVAPLADAHKAMPADGPAQDATTIRVCRAYDGWVPEGENLDAAYRPNPVSCDSFEALAGASLTIKHGDSVQRVVTGLDGRVVVPTLTGPVEIVATHDWAVSRTQDALAEAGVFIDVILETRHVNVTGRVLDEAGKGLAGVNICCFNGEVYSGADGAFTISLPAGPASLDAYRDGYQQVTVTIPNSTQALAPIRMRAMPPPNAHLSGHVWDQAGNPVANASVSVDANTCCDRDESTEGPDGTVLYYSPRSMGVTVRTDADGRFALGVQAGYVTVTTQPDGYSMGHAEAEIAPGGSEELHVGVIHFPARSTHIKGSFTDLAGTALGFAQLGSVNLEIQNLEYDHSECILMPGQSEGDAESSVTATGTTTDANDEGKDWNLTLIDSGPGFGPGGSCAIRLSANGSFEGDLMPGFTRFSLIVGSTCEGDHCVRGYRNWRRTVTLPANATYTLEARLVPLPVEDSEIRGYVLDRDFHPVPFANIDLEQDNGYYASATTAADGSYHLRAPAGWYQFNLWADGFLHFEDVLEAQAGHTTMLDVQLVKNPVGVGCCNFWGDGLVMATGSADRVQSVSVMEEAPTDESSAAGLGPYDRAARASYLGHPVVVDGLPAKPALQADLKNIDALPIGILLAGLVLGLAWRRK